MNIRRPVVLLATSLSLTSALAACQFTSQFVGLQNHQKGEVRFVLSHPLRTLGFQGECASGIVYADVFIQGSGTNSEVTAEQLNIPLSGSTSTQSFSLPLGSNYSAKVVGKDGSFQPVAGAEMYVAHDVQSSPQALPVTWSTTPVGRVLYDLATGSPTAKAKAATLNRTTLASKLPNLHGALIDAAAIATEIKNETVNLATIPTLDLPAYRHTTIPITVNVTGISSGDEITVCTNDPVSPSVDITADDTSESTVINVSPFTPFGNTTWDVKVKKGPMVKTGTYTSGGPATVDVGFSGTILSTYLPGVKAHSVAIDSAGNAWYSGANNNVIHKFSVTGSLIATYLTPHPNTGIDVDDDDNVWLASYHSATSTTYATKMSPTGAVLATYLAATGVTHYFALDIDDSTDDVWMSLGQSTMGGIAKVAKLTSAGALVGVFELGGGLSSIATMLIADGSGGAWVATGSGLNRLYHLSSAGTVLSTIYFAADPTGLPSGIALDSGGNVWVSHGNNASISKYSSAGAHLATISLPPYAPQQIAFDPSGNIWVSNYYDTGLSAFSSLVTKLSSTGSIIATYSTFGSGSYDIGIDGPNGNVWVSNVVSLGLARLSL